MKKLLKSKICRSMSVCILGEEWAEGKLKALFFRVNNKLYAYVDDAARQAYRNIRMGVPPPTTT